MILKKEKVFELAILDKYSYCHSYISVCMLDSIRMCHCN